MVLCNEVGEALSNSSSPQNSGRRQPEQMFSKTNVNINVKYYKSFGCPLYDKTTLTINVKKGGK